MDRFSGNVEHDVDEQEVHLVHIQRQLTLNINPNEPFDRPKPPESAAVSNAAGQSSGLEGQGRTPAEILSSVSSAVADSNGIDLSDSYLSFAVDGKTGVTVINVVDNETDEVIRQIPHNDILKLKRTIGELQGLALDRKA